MKFAAHQSKNISIMLDFCQQLRLSVSTFCYMPTKQEPRL